MADFLIVFLVTFAILAFVAIAMLLGRKPVYQPSEADIQSTLTRMLEGQLPEVEWEFFIRMPIYTDEALEQLRLKCADLSESYSLRARLGKARLDERGIIKLRFIVNQLESGGSKSF